MLTGKEEGLDYTKEAIASHKPTYKVIGDKLFVDGIPVDDWQITVDELKLYFPIKYAEKYGCGMVSCPACDKKNLESNRIVSWRSHVAMAHDDILKKLDIDKSVLQKWEDWVAIYETLDKE